MSPDSRPRPSSTRLLPPSHSCNLQTAAASFLFTRRGYPQGMEAPLLPGRGEELKEQGLGVWTILASLIQTEQPPISRGGGRSREVRHLSQCGPANAWRGQSGSQTGPCPVLCSVQPTVHISVARPGPAAVPSPAAVSRVFFRHCPPPDPPTPSPAQHCTCTGEMSALRQQFADSHPHEIHSKKYQIISIIKSKMS